MFPRWFVLLFLYIFIHVFSIFLCFHGSGVCGFKVAQRLNDERVQKPLNGADSLWGNKPSHRTAPKLQNQLPSPTNCLTTRLFAVFLVNTVRLYVSGFVSKLWDISVVAACYKESQDKPCLQSVGLNYATSAAFRCGCHLEEISSFMCTRQKVTSSLYLWPRFSKMVWEDFLLFFLDGLGCKT